MNDTCHITIDTSHVVGNLDHSWRYLGYDECNYTYMPEGKALLTKFGDLPDAPYYVRTHFMFCNGSCHGTQKFGSTNLYREDADGRAIYDFTYYDLMLDTILATGNKPFVELGFMPQPLADPSYRKQPALGGVNAYREVGWTYPPADYGKWHDFIRTVATHLADRYGEDEIRTWYFELWNEPDIFYWSGTDDDYCTLFDYTEHALHDALPSARLAGPACTGIFLHNGSRALMRTFLAHCREGRNRCTGETGTRLDFITFHAKGSWLPGDDTAAKSVPSVGSLVHQVDLALDVIAEEGFGDREVVISEADPDGWAAGGIADNPNMRFRNTEYYASYVAATYTRLHELCVRRNVTVRPLAWAFMFPQEECFAGTRTFATQGIDKPVMNAFRMFSRMGDHEVALRSDHAVDPAVDRRLIADFDEAAPMRYTGEGAQTVVSGFATAGRGAAADGVHGNGADGCANLQVLLYSHCDDIDVHDNRDVELRIDGLDAGRYRVTQYRVDGTHSNAHTVWLAEGSPKYPTGAQYDAIHTAGELETLEPERTVEVTDDADHAATLRFAMPTHAVALITLTRL
ncbi:glycosyl hydrolase family 39 [Bifidobacterium ramosum]|uniref:Glycosyl hydrolase family 39 n=1 Tax=Bifidobacterium ramosum TaxID=1798158 RepID=A0A6L4WZ44_9BIFI|nr:hypothetical protein [Bifidobacterium ramosum]KAB8286979.1 glycosyl hydrolase family 39 [Bifidobacterium ramosum]NEG72513.1 hypothetical protein [Bifidobacterium ramosum]